MGLRIGTNIAALRTVRNLNRVGQALENNFARLSTGRSFAHAGDNPSGAALSSRLKARIRSTDIAGRSVQDGISLLRTADATLVEVEGSVQRMRELAQQAVNGTLATADLVAIQDEFDDLATQVTDLADKVTFNGIALLNNTNTTTVQTGPDTGDTIVITRSNVSAGSSGLSVSGLDVTTSTATAQAALTAVDTAIASLSAARTSYGTKLQSLQGIYNGILSQSENLKTMNARIEDVDVASETAELTKNSVLQQAGVAVLAQANANARNALPLLGF